MLERKSMIMYDTKLYLIFWEEGLSVRRRRSGKPARGSCTPMPVPQLPSQGWSLDFLSGTQGACRKFRILAVNVDCCRENFAPFSETSISGAGGRANWAPWLVSMTKRPVSSVTLASSSPARQAKVGQRERRRMALHRRWEAAAERLLRIGQRQPA